MINSAKPITAEELETQVMGFASLNPSYTASTKSLAPATAPPAACAISASLSISRSESTYGDIVVQVRISNRPSGCSAIAVQLSTQSPQLIYVMPNLLWMAA